MFQLNQKKVKNPNKNNSLFSSRFSSPTGPRRWRPCVPARCRCTTPASAWGRVRRRAWPSGCSKTRKKKEDRAKAGKKTT